MSFLANAIQSARRSHGWSQAELAERVGVSQSAISFWENGVETPVVVHQVRLIELMPEILHALASQELTLMDRIQALERQLFGGKCACTDCNCSSEAGFTPISARAGLKE